MMDHPARRAALRRGRCFPARCAGEPYSKRDAGRLEHNDSGAVVPMLLRRSRWKEQGGEVATNRSAFTDLVGCTLPIQLAAMGGVGSAELAAAVANAGGLGMLPMGVEPRHRRSGPNFVVDVELGLGMFSE